MWRIKAMDREKKGNTSSKHEELSALINERIEKLRPKLLDLTRRNPLLSTNFSERSHSHVRIVDELPNIIYRILIENKMQLVPLPSLEAEPNDEKTRKFNNALADARLTDATYIATLESIDQDADDSADKLAIGERVLKDRVREKLGLHPRQTKNNLSLTIHAVNHGILPHYDLPLPENENKDGKHQDNIIQTLLLPDYLNKKLSSLLTKHKTWTQETGINVLRAAFGFLEWSDAPSSNNCFAPLVLLPIEIEKKLTKRGYEYWVSGQGDSAETNTVLAEKLKHDYGMILPTYDPEADDLEAYFQEVGKICRSESRWRIRRQVAVGVFPSARMAMYHDLDTKTWDFAGHETIKCLFGAGQIENGAAPFADEYEIDSPKIEAKVPLIVMDADSSQHSVMVDILDEKSIAVEGPPGTGKSQTIVNTIAAALNQGKKVLFVAEKMAALEVVRSRLEACGIGEYLLTLQANRSSKEQVIQSIRARLSMKRQNDPEELDSKKQQYDKVRSELNQYVKVISSPFAETGHNIYKIIGWGIAGQQYLQKNGIYNPDINIPRIRTINNESMGELRQLCDQAEAIWEKTNKLTDNWAFIKRANIDPYTADAILLETRKCAESYDNSVQLRKQLNALSLSPDTSTDNARSLLALLEMMHGVYEDINLNYIRRVIEKDAYSKLIGFLEESRAVITEKIALGEVICDPLLENASEMIAKLADAMANLGISTPSDEEANNRIIVLDDNISLLKSAKTTIDTLEQIVKDIKNNDIPSIILLLDIADSAGNDALSLRSDALQQPEAKELIMYIAIKTEALLAQQDRLNMVFRSIKSVDMKIIAETLNILVKSNIFSYLSPKYYRAITIYKSLTREHKYSKQYSIQQLRELMTWHEEMQQINKNSKIGQYLGNYYRGAETNFQPFIKLIKFYDRIDNELKGIEQANLRLLLTKGAYQSLISLPKLNQDHALRNIKEKNYSELESRIFFLESEREKLINSKNIMDGCLKTLNMRFMLQIDELMGIATRLNILNNKWHDLSKNELIQYVFDIKELVPMNLPISLTTSLNLLKEIEKLSKDLKKAVLSSLDSVNLARNIEIIKAIMASDISAADNMGNLLKMVHVDMASIFINMNHKEIGAYLSKATNDKEGLITYSQLYAAQHELSEVGYGHIIDMLMNKPIKYKGLFNTINALIGSAMTREVYEEYGNILSKYNGVKLDGLRRRLAGLDKEILKLSQQRIRAALKTKAHPPAGTRSGRRSEWTDLALLNNEISKQMRYLSARELTMRASEALLELKPCWMMSPLAVAQYIPKGDITFDLLIIDEASQMTPEDAIGAIVRSKQSMIVGDTNQLPPSSFFKKYLDIQEEDEGEVVNEESILEMANAVFRPARRLRWHYRSKHPQLIAFSNKYVYNNDLIVFPSPNTDIDVRSIISHKVNGLYSNGTNPIEASMLADEAINIMHKNKEISLGVVVLNQRQRDLIIDEIEYRISQDALAQDYIEYWNNNKDGLESFFIKNLENVQGDERDVIMIGTVYGPEKENAPVMQRFGPINGINGKRRLNVLFSRAKSKIITISSMTANDIRVDEQSNEGVALLKYWLEYCATGKTLSDVAVSGKPESIFEEYVISQLESIGCKAVPQVGVVGYFIDIGVKHPKWPHGYIMGIECDGANYHSSKSARDRDRLRQEVLERMGWYLYRIWSTDWFTDPINEADKMRLAIEARLSSLLTPTNNQ